MPRPSKPTVLARLGEAVADLVQNVFDTLRPRPKPDPIPVRVRERR